MHFSLQLGHVSGGIGALTVLPHFPHFQKGSLFFTWAAFSFSLITFPFY